jgi:hypothetical protein
MDVAVPFEAEANELGMGYSLFLADLLAARYQLPLPSQRQTKRHRALPSQAALPLPSQHEEVPRLSRAS